MIRVFLVLLFLQCGEAYSVKNPLSLKKTLLQETPIQIEALNGIECDKENKICKAFNATVVNKEMTLKGDILKVTFDEKQGLQKLEAFGNIFIDSGQDYKATGEEGSFDMQLSIAVLEKSAKVYDLKKKRTLAGDKIVLHFNKNKENKMDIERVDVSNNVEIKTEKEIIKSNKAFYLAGRDFIKLTGDVRITSKNGQLRGDTAEMNLKTGLSQMKSTKEPVKVLMKLPPKKEKINEH